MQDKLQSTHCIVHAQNVVAWSPQPASGQTCQIGCSRMLRGVHSLVKKACSLRISLHSSHPTLCCG